MSTGVTLSAAVRNNLLSLQSTAAMMATTQNRLATGNKVNSAVDNATSYFTAQGLNNRASDLSGLQDNMSLAVKTVQAASNGIDGISKLVTQAQAVVNQAGQVTGTATATTATFAKAKADTLAAGTIQVGSAAAVTLDYTGAVGATGADKTAWAINNSSALKTAGVTASVDSTGALSISGSTGEALTLALKDSSSAAVTEDTNVTGKTADADKTAKLQDYVNQYNNLRDQIDQISADASYNGVNLLNSQNLTVNFNAKGTSSLALTGVDMTAGGKLGLDSVDATKLTDGTASKALNSATSTLRTQSSVFGSNLAVINTRQDFTKSTIDNLQAGAGDLTLADTNQEGANLLALQTRQSLATTALSLSNQAQSSILSIIR